MSHMRRTQRLRTLILFVGLAWLPGVAFAQTPALPTDRLGWDQAAPSLATAQAYEYGIYVDGLARAVVTGVTCAGAASPFPCVGNLPAMTPGTHSLELTAAEAGFVAATESLHSTPLPIRLVVAPAVPINTRIVRTP